MSKSSNNRPDKGSSIIAFPSDFCVLDLETTGYSPYWDEIIEIGLIKVRNNTIVETYSTLIQPEEPIDEYITELTGITNEMVDAAPSIENVLPEVVKFIGDDIIVGHKVSFDINFLYDALQKYMEYPLGNDHVNTARISHKVFPEMEHHRLRDVAEALQIDASAFHRSLADCDTTYKCFCALHERITASGNVEDFAGSFKQKHKSKIDLRELAADTTDFDETHPLFGKRCVFTGALERMSRAEAAQCVLNVGGFCDNGVTKKTNVLILGNNDYCTTIKDGKSSKQKKAEEYSLKGYDIIIIPENVFYDMLEE